MVSENLEITLLFSSAKSRLSTGRGRASRCRQDRWPAARTGRAMASARRSTPWQGLSAPVRLRGRGGAVATACRLAGRRCDAAHLPNGRASGGFPRHATRPAESPVHRPSLGRNRRELAQAQRPPDGKRSGPNKCTGVEIRLVRVLRVNLALLADGKSNGTREGQGSHVPKRAPGRRRRVRPDQH